MTEAWIVNEMQDDFGVYYEVMVAGGSVTVESREMAYLIAAAPKMARVLREALNATHGWRDMAEAVLAQVKAQT